MRYRSAVVISDGSPLWPGHPNPVQPVERRGRKRERIKPRIPCPLNTTPIRLSGLSDPSLPNRVREAFDMDGIRRRLAVLAMGLSGISFAACGAASPLVLTSADIPSFLGVHANPGVFTTVAGGEETVMPMPIGPHEQCPEWYHNAFVPPGRHGEAAAGEGVPITYAEVMILAWHCADLSQARLGFHLLSDSRQSVTGVSDQAAILNRTDDSNDGYPDSRVFIIDWREGQAVGALELAGPDSDKRITPALAELLARRAAATT